MKNQLLGAVTASALIAAAGLAHAQETASEPEAIVTGGEGIYLDPITIFATLNPISTFDYPGQVSVVDRDEIATKQADSLGDIVRDVPGVFLDGGTRRSGQAPTIRGFREEDILILIDGVKQSFISGHDGRIFVDPSLLKTAEIVKGPLSALYGSGALGGVIALTTVDAADFLDPGETSGIQVKAGYQSVNDEFTTTSTGFTRSADGKLDAIASFTYRDSGDISLGNGTTLQEDEEIASSLVKATGELSPDLKLTGTWVHYQDDALNPNNPQADNSGDLVNRFVQSDTVSAKLAYNPTGNPFIDGNLLVYWAQHLSEEDHSVKGSTRLTERTIETTGFNIDNRSRFELYDTTNLTLTYGGEYYIDRQTGEDNEPLGGGTVPNVPDADASDYGLFTQAEIKFGNPAGLPGELSVIPGIRWDGFENAYRDTEDYEDFEDQAISKKLGLAYKPAPWLLVFGNYGEAFRAPSYTELYAQGIHFPGGGINNIFLSNPDLKPQEGVTLEAGLGFDFKDIAQYGDRLTLKGSYWKTDADNFIDLDVVTAGCGFGPTPLDQSTCYTQNVNKNAELDGVEIEMKYDSARWFANAGYTHIDGIDTDTGLYLGTLQPDKITLDAGVKVPEIWARFGTRFTFADEFTKVNPDETTGTLPIRDAYNLVDIYAVFEPLDGPFKNFRLDLGVDNITDEDYELVTAGVFEEGINYKAAISWTQKW
jgi:hemoglobin/transferrin/lactoferrin receptor protein